MAQTDWDFVFDGVFGFLVSPMWQIPVMTFIEKHCEVFDPSEEISLGWSELHSQYRSLVENLLSSYLKDVGITEEQFVKACSTPAAQERAQMQIVFEQIWAAEDFEIFKRMMIQRNIELQLQALQLIQERQGLKPQQEQQQVPTPGNPEEDEILQAVLRHSKEEYERSQQGKSKQEDKFNTELEQALAKSEEDAKRLKEAIEKQAAEKNEVVKATLAVEQSVPKSEVSISAKPELEQKEDTSSKTTPKPESKKTSSPAKSAQGSNVKEEKTTTPRKADPVKQKASSPKKLPPVSNKGKPSTDAASAWLKSAQEDTVTSTAQPPQATSHSEEEIKRREEYLKQQRDRLLAMKKNEREKRLTTFTKTQPKRPASARAAREAVAEVSDANQAKSVTVDDPKKLAMRRALAERLKKEVIDKQGAFDIFFTLKLNV